MKKLVLASAIAVSLASVTGASADRAMFGVDRVESGRMHKGTAAGDRRACADLLITATPACGGSSASAAPRPDWRGLN